MPGKIAYVMSRFPHLPETFILREMNEVERLGWHIVLYPLLVQPQSVMHAEAAAWLPRAQQIPFLSGAVMKDNGRVLCRHPLSYLRLCGQTVLANATSPNFLVRALALFPKAVHAAQQMQAEGVTHIHAHYATHPALFAWLIHRLTGISYSITVHAHDIFVRTAMLAVKLRSASFIAAISHYNREHLAKLVGPWVRDKTHIVHCGINPDRYQARSGPAAPGHPLDILSIGSLQPYKGHTYLLQACALLQQQGIPFRCRIIGGGAEQRRLEQLAAGLGLNGQVQLLGPQPQEYVAELLPTANCYVQPSVVTPSGKMEGIPVALMEAMACRLPVVATDLSGVPELVQPGKTGYLTPPADAPALAGALAEIYAAPQTAWTTAVAGQALVHKEFNLQNSAARLAALFRQHAGQQVVAYQPQPVQG